MALTPKLSKRALDYINSLDRTTQSRITSKINELCLNPFDIGLSKPLKQRSERSSRVGDYRILFMVVESDLVVSKVGHRREVYD